MISSRRSPLLSVLLLLVLGGLTSTTVADDATVGLQPLKYNHPGLVVDLGVGLWAWPMPVDYNGNGKLDLLISTSFSEDGGQTWSKMTGIDLPNNNSGVEAVTLADGRHLLIYNHLPAGDTGWGRRTRSSIPRRSSPAMS